MLGRGFRDERRGIQIKFFSQKEKTNKSKPTTNTDSHKNMKISNTSSVISLLLLGLGMVTVNAQIDPSYYTNIEREKANNMNLWKTNNIQAYSFTLNVLSDSSGNYPWRATVQNGVERSAYDKNNNPVSAPLMNNMYDEIQILIDYKAYPIDVSYDWRGVPNSIYAVYTDGTTYQAVISDFNYNRRNLRSGGQARQLQNSYDLLRQQWAAAIATWNSQNIRDYTLSLNVLSGASGNYPYRVTFRNGVQSSFDRNGNPVSAPLINNMFDEINILIKQQARNIAVSYDLRGFPTTIYAVNQNGSTYNAVISGFSPF